MSSQNIINIIEQFLTGNSENIKFCEQYFSQNALQKGWPQNLMMIIDNTQVSSAVRQFTITQLKQVIEKYWVPHNEKKSQLNEEDKSQVRQNVIVALIRTQDQKLLLKSYKKIIQIIARNDLKDHENFFLSSIQDNLIINQNDPNNYHTLYGTAIIINAIFKEFQYAIATERQPVVNIQMVIFPKIISLSEILLQNYNQYSSNILRYILKSIHSSIFIGIDDFLLQNNNTLFIQIVQLMLNVISKEIPEEYIQLKGQLSDKEKEDSCFWKDKKCATKIAIRFFQKYSVNLLQKQAEGLANELKQKYNNQFLNIFYQLISKRKQYFISKGVMINILRCFFYALTIDEQTQSINVFIDDLIFNHCIPLVRFDDEDLQQYQSDQIEFIRKEYDFKNLLNRVKYCAVDVIDQACSKLKTQRPNLLIEVITYIYECLRQGVMKNSQEKIDDFQLDGLLQIILCLDQKIQKYLQVTNQANQIEVILEQVILPKFDHQQSFIRLRTCEIYGDFGSFEFKNQQTVQIVTQKMVQCLMSKDLPLSIKAAIGLNKFFKQKLAHQLAQNEIKQLFNVYLEVMGKIDAHEELISSLQGIIYEFQENIGEYALEICIPVINNFYTLFKKDQENDYNDDSDLENEVNVVSGKCIDVVKAIVSAPHKQEVHNQLGQLIFPLIDFNLKQSELEYQDEICSLISVFIYNHNQGEVDKKLHFYYSVLSYGLIGIPQQLDLTKIPSITPEELEILNNNKDGIEEEYIEEYIPFFKNFLQKTKATFLQSHDILGNTYLDLYFGIVDKLVKNGINEQEYIDSTGSLHMLYTLIENYAFTNSLDSIIERIIQQCMSYYQIHGIPKYFKKAVLLAISLCFFYKSSLALSTLEKFKVTQIVIQQIMELIEDFSGYLETDFMLLGLAALFKVSENDIPQSIQNLMPQIFSTMIPLTTAVLKARQEDESEDSINDSDDDEDYIIDYYTNYKSPLETVDEILYFQDNLNHLKATSPEYFQKIISQTSLDNQKQLEKNFEEAKSYEQDQSQK